MKPLKLSKYLDAPLIGDRLKTNSNTHCSKQNTEPFNIMPKIFLFYYLFSDE